MKHVDRKSRPVHAQNREDYCSPARCGPPESLPLLRLLPFPTASGFARENRQRKTIKHRAMTSVPPVHRTPTEIEGCEAQVRWRSDGTTAPTISRVGNSYVVPSCRTAVGGKPYDAPAARHDPSGHSTP